MNKKPIVKYVNHCKNVEPILLAFPSLRGAFNKIKDFFCTGI